MMVHKLGSTVNFRTMSSPQFSRHYCSSLVVSLQRHSDGGQPGGTKASTTLRHASARDMLWNTRERLQPTMSDWALACSDVKSSGLLIVGAQCRARVEGSRGRMFTSGPPRCTLWSMHACVATHCTSWVLLLWARVNVAMGGTLSARWTVHRFVPPASAGCNWCWRSPWALVHMA